MSWIKKNNKALLTLLKFSDIITYTSRFGKIGEAEL